MSLKRAFIDFVMSFIQKYNAYSDDDVKKLRYGIEGLYLTFTKIFIIIILSLILGIFKEVLITLILFNIIRYTGFGFHAEKSWHCLVLSLIYFIAIPLLFMNIHLSQITAFIICIICIISYLLFAPADTVKRPLTNKKKRVIRKISTILIGIIYTGLILIFPTHFVTPLMISVLVVQAVIINPLFYKLFGLPYNNYKNYVKA